MSNDQKFREILRALREAGLTDQEGYFSHSKLLEDIAKAGEQIKKQAE